MAWKSYLEYPCYDSRGNHSLHLNFCFSKKGITVTDGTIQFLPVGSLTEHLPTDPSQFHWQYSKRIPFRTCASENPFTLKESKVIDDVEPTSRQVPLFGTWPWTFNVNWPPYARALTARLIGLLEALIRAIRPFALHFEFA